MTRLSLATLNDQAAAVARPAYDPTALNIGVVHFGPGAFHRAHQAAYFDALAASDPRFGICGVSLHSAGVRDALAPQDGLYTLAVLDSEISYRTIGAMREVIVAPEDPEAVFARMRDPAVKIVTSTVTEKGYCLNADYALDLTHPDVVHDLENPESPRSFIGYVAAGLRHRRRLGLPFFAVIPCDNLPKNGERLREALAQFAWHFDGEMAGNIRRYLQCPCTMVDSITPATDDVLRTRVAEATGVEDAWPIQRESFTQWVIENYDNEDGPDWQSVGVTLTDNVPAYERAKLRLLNGPHSTLAYCGLHKGYETVSEAMADPELAALVRDLMIKDVVPLLEAPAGMDLPGYCEAILKRFRNPAIRHLLSQIAWDGSQKLPIRILSSMSEARDRGMDISRLCRPLAAWMRFVRQKAVTGGAITDPLADQLLALGAGLGDTPADVKAFLALRAVFPETLANDPHVIASIEAAYADLLTAEPAAA